MSSKSFWAVTFNHGNISQFENKIYQFCCGQATPEIKRKNGTIEIMYLTSIL